MKGTVMEATASAGPGATQVAGQLASGVRKVRLCSPDTDHRARRSRFVSAPQRI